MKSQFFRSSKFRSSNRAFGLCGQSSCSSPLADTAFSRPHRSVRLAEPISMRVEVGDDDDNAAGDDQHTKADPASIQLDLRISAVPFFVDG